MAGRNKAATAGERISCAYDLCQDRAIARLNTNTGWANLCKRHYDFRAEADSEVFCDAQGLKTVAEKQAWCRQKMKSFGHGDFSDWAARLEQKDVDFFKRLGFAQLIQKLRDHGLIDSEGLRKAA